MSVPRSIKDPIANQLQVDPGEIFFVVDSLSDGYAEMLRKKGVTAGSIFSTVNAAYAACTANQDDIVAVKPGIHTLTADLHWAKDHTHLIGRGGPIQEGDTYTSGTVITSGLSGTTSVETLHITSEQCQFHNALFEQGQAAATAVTAVKVAGMNNLFKSCSMIGLMDATQDVDHASSLDIGPDASFSRFIDCNIGSPNWHPRGTEVSGGQILFSNTASGTAPCDILFKGCQIKDSSATDHTHAVYLAANYAVDRLLEFRDCTFYNFQVNLGTVLEAGVIHDECGTTHIILLSGTTCQYGWEDWNGGTKTYTFVGVPVCSGTGGTALIATTA